jgi:hypothetical protein
MLEPVLDAAGVPSRPEAGLGWAVPPIRQGVGRPRRRPGKLHADKGYDFPRCRRACRQRRIIPRIARRGIESSERLGRHRWVVERTHAWFARLRRLTVRGACPPAGGAGPGGASSRYRRSLPSPCRRPDLPPIRRTMVLLGALIRRAVRVRDRDEPRVDILGPAVLARNGAVVDGEAGDQRAGRSDERPVSFRAELGLVLGLSLPWRHPWIGSPPAPLFSTASRPSRTPAKRPRCSTSCRRSCFSCSAPPWPGPTTSSRSSSGATSTWPSCGAFCPTRMASRATTRSAR